MAGRIVGPILKGFTGPSSGCTSETHNQERYLHYLDSTLLRRLHHLDSIEVDVFEGAFQEILYLDIIHDVRVFEFVLCRRRSGKSFS